MKLLRWLWEPTPADLFLASRVVSGTQQVTEQVRQLLPSTTVGVVTLNLEPQTLAHAAALKMYSGHTEPPRGHDGAGNGDYRGGH